MASGSSDAALRTFLDQPDAVIFVGSGMSIWSGLPGWETLLRNLIGIAAAKGLSTRIAEEALANKQLLEAADALPLTQLEIANAMRGPIGFSHATPHEVHELLLRLGPQRFVTTNFDTLIEQQLGLVGKIGQFRTVTSRQVAELADIVKASADAFIFKPHGDLSDAQSLVLATRHYEQVLAGEANHVRRTIETLLVTRPVLFLGYGLRDPDTGLVLRTLRDRHLGNVGHFKRCERPLFRFYPGKDDRPYVHRDDRRSFQAHSRAAIAFVFNWDFGKLPLSRTHCYGRFCL